MSSKSSQPEIASSLSKANTLLVRGAENKTPDRLLADLGLSPITSNASTARTFARGFGEIGITEAAAVLEETVGKIRVNNLTALEDTLAAQATALNSIFTELARRAASNMGEYMNATEIYLRLAFKAQAQCRATIETLAEIKNPRPIAFVKQANIAQGAQQVNNGVSPPARARESEDLQNKLLEMGSGECLDAGAAGAAIGGDPAMETVGARNRPENEGR